MLIEAYRFPPGAAYAPRFLATLVFEGALKIGDETLEAWDLIHPSGEGNPGTASFPDGGTVLAVSMR
jgi:hypothetical protein